MEVQAYRDKANPVWEHRIQLEQQTPQTMWMLIANLLISWGKSQESYVKGMSYLTSWAKVLMAESISQSILSHMIG